MLKKMGTLTCVAALALAALPAAASASDARDHVRDARGHAVMDARGNCIRTKWDGNNGCSTAMDQESRTVYFDFGSSKLTAEGKRRLDNLIKNVKSAVDVESVDIVGYTDHIGNNAANDKLSRARAEAVRGYLVKTGKLKVKHLKVEGLGATASVSQCDAKALKKPELIKCLWRDRRVEVKLNMING